MNSKTNRQSFQRTLNQPLTETVRQLQLQQLLQEVFFQYLAVQVKAPLSVLWHQDSKISVKKIQAKVIIIYSNQRTINFSGAFMYSTNSITSCLASFIPATSRNDIFGTFTLTCGSTIVNFAFV